MRCSQEIDWASEEHAVCVNDPDGRIVERRRYCHDERGITALCRRLLSSVVVLVAVERPDGLLIERLLRGNVPDDSSSRRHCATATMRGSSWAADRSVSLSRGWSALSSALLVARRSAFAGAGRCSVSSVAVMCCST